VHGMRQQQVISAAWFRGRPPQSSSVVDPPE
jgi:hypothetical protein